MRFFSSIIALFSLLESTILASPAPSLASICYASAYPGGARKILVCCETFLEYPDEKVIDGLCYPLQALSGSRCDLVKSVGKLNRACCDDNELDYVKTPTAGKVC